MSFPRTQTFAPIAKTSLPLILERHDLSLKNPCLSLQKNVLPSDALCRIFRDKPLNFHGHYMALRGWVESTTRDV